MDCICTSAFFAIHNGKNFLIVVHATFLPHFTALSWLLVRLTPQASQVHMAPASRDVKSPPQAGQRGTICPRADFSSPSGNSTT